MTDGRQPGRGKTPPSPSGSFGGITSGASSRSVPRAQSAGARPTASAMRTARRRWATGVCVLTSIAVVDDTSAFRGATVSSFSPLSIEPPLVAVALEVGGRMATTIAESRIFAVSILDRSHEFQSDRFSGYGPPADGGFTGIPHDVFVSGAPVLRDALAWFDCQVTSVMPAGDHVLVIGEVVATGLGTDTDDPLLNYEGAYRRIEGA